MSKSRRRRRSVPLQAEPDLVVTLVPVQLPHAYMQAACAADFELAAALGLPADPDAWTEAQGELLSVELDRLAAEIHGLVSARRHLSLGLVRTNALP